jgi:hypothetical protein
MTRTIVLAAVSATLLTSAAQAQYASAQPAPLYPYATQPTQSYAIEVAPGTYVIHRPHNYPYVRCVNDCDGRDRAAEGRVPARKIERRVTHNDPALIEELRRRHAKPVRGDVVNTTRIVRDKPVVIEHQRVVDDPPRVIERRHYVDDAPPARAAKVATDVAPPRAPARAGKAEKATVRTIRAEAEVTILGPDRMSIRLFRKRGAGSAKAEAD